MASEKTANFGWTKIDPEGKVDVASDVNTPLDEIDASLNTVNIAASSKELFPIKATNAGGEGLYSSETTYSEIIAAIDAGKKPYLIVDDSGTSTLETVVYSNYVYAPGTITFFRTEVQTDSQPATIVEHTIEFNFDTYEIKTTSKVADYTEVADNASYALGLAQINETDIATLDAEMAGTTDSGLKTLIENKVKLARSSETFTVVNTQGTVSTHSSRFETPLAKATNIFIVTVANETNEGIILSGGSTNEISEGNYVDWSAAAMVASTASPSVATISLTATITIIEVN